MTKTELTALRSRVADVQWRVTDMERRLTAATRRESEYRYLLRETAKAARGERVYDDELARQVEQALR